MAVDFSRTADAGRVQELLAQRRRDRAAAVEAAVEPAAAAELIEVEEVPEAPEAALEPQPAAVAEAAALEGPAGLTDSPDAPQAEGAEPRRSASERLGAMIEAHSAVSDRGRTRSRQL